MIEIHYKDNKDRIIKNSPSNSFAKDQTETGDLPDKVHW